MKKSSITNKTYLEMRYLPTTNTSHIFKFSIFDDDDLMHSPTVAANPLRFPTLITAHFFASFLYATPTPPHPTLDPLFFT
jgi:hypothetical protein